MTSVTGSDAALPDVAANAPASREVPAGWQELRRSEDIQFEPVEIPEIEPQEPGWFQRFLEWLGDLISPLGALFGNAWPVMKWVLLALAITAVLYIVWRIVEQRLGPPKPSQEEHEETLWVPDRAESAALLEDADRLAAEGRYDEATHLLLQRSVGQIAAARPDWVEPSSTARELAALPALSDAARSAFRTMADRVERSLFALRNLDRADWEAARAAYAQFAQVRFERARPDHSHAIGGSA